MQSFSYLYLSVKTVIPPLCWLLHEERGGVTFLWIPKARCINPDSALSTVAISPSAFCTLSNVLKHMLRWSSTPLIHWLSSIKKVFSILQHKQTRTVNPFSKIKVCSPRSKDNKDLDDVSELQVVFHLDILPSKEHSWISSATHLGFRGTDGKPGLYEWLFNYEGLSQQVKAKKSNSVWHLAKIHK